MKPSRATLLVYNTVDRLLRGDLFHTVTVSAVRDDLAAFPPDWVIVGVGTTNWLRRNGEVIPDGTAGSPRFWWADPDGEPVGQVIDVCHETPVESGATLITPRVDSDDQQANFPFLVLALCDPANRLTFRGENITDMHSWLTAELAALNIGVVGVQVAGTFGHVKTTDAYNVPVGGLDLSSGYVGEDHFRFGDFESGDWVMNGVYAANASLQPFISVLGKPLHLHGFQPDALVGGHIVSAEAARVTVDVWTMDDFIMKIHDVGRAMNPVKAT